MPAYMPNDLQENAVGADIVLEAVDQDGLPVDVSGATVLEITVMRPDGSSFTRDAVVDTDGEDGLFRITTEDGDLVPAGPGWKAQGRYGLVGSTSIPTSVLTFEVLANIP